MRKLTPPTFALFCLLGMVGLHWTLPAGSKSSWVVLVIGAGFMTLGIGIAVGVEGQFRRNHTSVDHLGTSTKLATDGWFKHSRNPMYLSLALLLIGAWLALGSVSPLLGVITYLLLAERWYIMPEENRLAAAFGKDYESYQRRTSRWL